MGQPTNIVLTSGGVDYTFSPRGEDTNGVWTFVSPTGVPLADRRLTVQRSRTAAGREKASFKFTIPVVLTETVGGVTRSTVLRTAYADVSFSFDSTSTLAERGDLRNFILDLMGTTNPTGDVVDSLGYLY